MADGRGRWSGLLGTSFTKIVVLAQGTAKTPNLASKPCMVQLAALAPSGDDYPAAASPTSLLCASATQLRTSSFYTPCSLPMRPRLRHHVEDGPGLHLLLLWVHMNERTPFDKLPDN